MLADHLLPKISDLKTEFRENHRIGEPIFQQDGASAHTAETTRDFFGRNEVLVLPNWPPNSPDLNLIEIIWALIKQKLRNNPAKTIDELKEKVAYAFQEILFDGELTKKLYDSYERRLELVIQYEGARIPDEKRKKSTAKKN